MVPQTVLAFVGFLFLIAPGLFYELRREKRRPSIEETAFREASRTAFTSVMFTGAAVGVLAIVRAGWPDVMPDPGRWLRENGRYLESHYRLIAAFFVLELILALLFAFLTDRLFRRGAPGEIASGGIWYQVLRVDRPKNKAVWVSLQLTDNTQIGGFLKYYTAAEKLDNREIAVMNSWRGTGMLLRRPEGHGSVTSLEDWDTVVIPGDRIAYMKVEYRKAAKSQKESWWQRNAPPPSAVSPGPAPPAAGVTEAG